MPMNFYLEAVESVAMIQLLVDFMLVAEGFV